MRYHASDPTQHSARFGDRELEGVFLGIRSTLRDELHAARPTADYSLLVALVDRLRSAEPIELTFLLARHLFGGLAGLPASETHEELEVLEARYAEHPDSTEPHDGAFHRFGVLVQSLMDERPADRRDIAHACFETVAWLASRTFASRAFVGSSAVRLTAELLRLFERYPETADFVPGVAALGLVLTPEGLNYEHFRAQLRQAYGSSR